MNVLDLFSGIGGFSLGLERAGMRTIAFCEINPFCRAVLRRHWPNVPCWPDVREVRAARLYNLGLKPIDVICGGFPCQDISSAGKKAGIGGLRSGLWIEYARLVREVRPRYVIVENSADLLARGLGIVLGDLAEIGYDAEWHCISAAAIGACHGRDRCWIIGYPNGNGESGLSFDAEASWSAAHDSNSECRLGPLGRYLAGIGWQGQLDASNPWIGKPEDQPDFLGVAHGLPQRMDRLRSIGNAVVPQIPELIGRAIMQTELADTSPEKP